MLNLATPFSIQDAPSPVMFEIAEPLEWENAQRPLLFFENEATLLQPVPQPPIPNAVDSYVHQARNKVSYTRDDELREEEMMRKPESHITVIGFDHGRLIKRRLAEIALEEDTNASLATMARIRELVKETTFAYKPLPYYYKMQRAYTYPTPYTEMGEVRTTIVQLVQVDGLQKFYKALSNILEMELTPPPPHITLYSHSTNPKNMNTGIGLPTEGCFKKLVLESIPPNQNMIQEVQ